MGWVSAGGRWRGSECWAAERCWGGGRWLSWVGLGWRLVEAAARGAAAARGPGDVPAGPAAGSTKPAFAARSSGSAGSQGRHAPEGSETNGRTSSLKAALPIFWPMVVFGVLETGSVLGFVASLRVVGDECCKKGALEGAGGREGFRVLVWDAVYRTRSVAKRRRRPCDALPGPRRPRRGSGGTVFFRAKLQRSTPRTPVTRHRRAAL